MLIINELIFYLVLKRIDTNCSVQLKIYDLANIQVCSVLSCHSLANIKLKSTQLRVKCPLHRQHMDFLPV